MEMVGVKIATEMKRGPCHLYFGLDTTLPYPPLSISHLPSSFKTLSFYHVHHTDYRVRNEKGGCGKGIGGEFCVRGAGALDRPIFSQSPGTPQRESPAAGRIMNRRIFSSVAIAECEPVITHETALRKILRLYLSQLAVNSPP